MEVVCQRCLKTFRVCCSRVTDTAGIPRRIADAIRANATDLYGDPPCHTTQAQHLTGMDGCAAGESVTSQALRVVEYWCRTGSGWTRDAALEVAFSHDAVEAHRMAAGKW